jgi:predicted dehydrogenase
LNVAIIGCGSIARQRHGYEYSQNPNVTITGYYDFDPARAQTMADTFGGIVFNTVDDLLADASIDAVSVCAANKYHAELTIKALNSGKHVLCEKPMATILKDCEDMVAAAHANGKRLLIGHNQRLAPAHVRAKQILASGQLGRVISFQSTFGHKGPEMWSIDQSANTWFFKKDAAAFGSMADLGIHKIDLVRYLVGGKVTSVFSQLATLDKKFPDGTPIEVDDNSVELLYFDTGALGTVTTSWTHYGEECNATVLYCENGIMKMYHNPQFSLEITYRDGTRAYFEIDRLQTNEDAQMAKSGVIDLFVDAILTGGATPLDAEDILHSMRVVFACLESSEKNAPVKL